MQGIVLSLSSSIATVGFGVVALFLFTIHLCGFLTLKVCKTSCHSSQGVTDVSKNVTISSKRLYR
jgi:hypothetical protein